jgi:hypothetical protein
MICTALSKVRVLSGSSSVAGGVMGMERFRLHRRNGLSESDDEESRRTTGSVGMAIMSSVNVARRVFPAPAVNEATDRPKVFEELGGCGKNRWLE